MAVTITDNGEELFATVACDECGGAVFASTDRADAREVARKHKQGEHSAETAP